MTTPPGGWIKLYRNIQKNPMWQEKPYSRGQAWVDLILTANSHAGIIRRRGIRINVRRGEIGYSLRELGDRWGWSLGKVQRFFDELKTDTQTDTRNDTENVSVTALIRLINYDKYQSSDTKNDTKNDTETGTETGTEQEGKELKTKILAHFDTFWTAYPKRKGKIAAQKAWSKIRLSEKQVSEILISLEWQTSQPDWQKDNGQYIPNPATWLNGQRWLDERADLKTDDALFRGMR